MNKALFRLRPILFLLCAGLLWCGSLTAEVLVQATPDGGLQPRLISDNEGGLHLLYFKKRIERRGAREGNLYYRPWLPEEKRFGTQVRVSSEAFPLQSYAIARAAMAIDGSGRLHVVWYLPRESAFYYSRSNPAGDQFEEQRLLVTENVEGIDAGADIAAVGDEVVVVWGAGDLSREHERAMYARFSDDGGASFGNELMISNPDLGACACCSMAADFIQQNELLVAYRSAIDGIGRHMQLLTVQIEDGEGVSAGYEPVQPLQEWEASFCPLSTNDINTGTDQRWLVFETKSRIVQMPLPAGERSLVGEPFIETRQKNPAIAFNQAGQHLVAWGEAISHTRGGRLNVRLFDSEGEPLDYRLPDEIQMGDFTFPAVAGLPNDDFLVLY